MNFTDSVSQLLQFYQKFKVLKADESDILCVVVNFHSKQLIKNKFLYEMSNTVFISYQRTTGNKKKNKGND